MINCDVVMSRFPIVSSRRLTIRCNRDVFEEKYSCIENKDGNRTELVLQSNVFWLKAKFLDGKADNKWLSDMNSVEMRTLEDQAKPTDYSASSSSMQQLIIRKELIQAEAYGQKIRVRLWPGNRSEAERDELKATQLPFWSWCTCGVDGKAPGQLHKCCSSDRDFPELQMDYFFKNCRSCDRMISNVLARLAETCETLDERSSLNLGRGKQGDAIRAPDTDVRVARLRCERGLTVELMTVSSISGLRVRMYDQACQRQGH